MTSSTAAASRVHEFAVTVTGCTRSDAERVLAERLAADEDYDFHYQITWQTTNLEHAGQATFGTCVHCWEPLVPLINRWLVRAMPRPRGSGLLRRRPAVTPPTPSPAILRTGRPFPAFLDRSPGWDNPRR